MQTRESVCDDIARSVDKIKHGLQRIVDFPEAAEMVQREAAKASQELHGIEAAIGKLLGIAESAGR